MSSSTSAVDQLIETNQGRLSVESTGRGPDLVLLHSLLTDRDAFDPIIPHLSDSWRVHKVALPGFGNSTPCEPAIDCFADAIGALLEQEFGQKTAALIGNGFGGFVALGTAVRHGRLFDRLVLLGCGTGFDQDGARVFDVMASKVGEGGMASIVDIGLKRIYSGPYLAEHEAEAEERRRVLLGTDPQSFITACRALRSVDFSSEAASVGNRTLIAVGSEDQATPPSMGEHLARIMPAASFSLLPGLAHAPQLQDPGALIAAIDPFLSGARRHA